MSEYKIIPKNRSYTGKREITPNQKCQDKEGQKGRAMGETSTKWVLLWERCQDKFKFEVKVARHNQFGSLEVWTEIGIEGQG